ncbi:hypothetical protein HY357_03610 [Candidatus Roizmanbacteria bacterium]|nr:hypothetical protein [Candidatus Roizmanbacteria bacterium]
MQDQVDLEKSIPQNEQESDGGIHFEFIDKPPEQHGSNGQQSALMITHNGVKVEVVHTTANPKPDSFELIVVDPYEKTDDGQSWKDESLIKIDPEEFTPQLKGLLGLALVVDPHDLMREFEKVRSDIASLNKLRGDIQRQHPNITDTGKLLDTITELQGKQPYLLNHHAYLIGQQLQTPQLKSP